METWEKNYDAWKLQTPEERSGLVQVDTCHYCNQEIYEGEEYYEFNGTIVCQDCIDDFISEYKKVANC